MAGTLLSSRNTRTNEQEAFLLEFFGPADGVGVVRVAAINDDITLLEVGDELLNKGVNGSTCLDKEDDFSWLLQLCNELLDGVSTLDTGTWKAQGVSISL